MSSDPILAPVFTPEQLVAIIQDSSRSAEEINQAWAGLIPIIEQTSLAVARRFDGPLRHEIAEESYSHVHRSINQYREEISGFRTWLWRVLYNKAITLYRKRMRINYHSLDDQNSSANESSPLRQADNEDQARLFGLLRRHLDQLMEIPSCGVDYHAVLLVVVRIRMAIVRIQNLGPFPQPGEWTEFAMEMVPWHDPEQKRRFRDGLPELIVLWAALENSSVERPNWECLVPVLQRHDKNITSAVLQQWATRARKWAKDHLGEETWNHSGLDRLASRNNSRPG